MILTDHYWSRIMLVFTGMKEGNMVSFLRVES
jgi:hypothetical protein